MNELSFLINLQQYRTPLLDSFFVFVTHLGDAGLVWAALTLALAARKSTRKEALTMALSLIICAVFTNFILKPLVARPRPFTRVDGLTLLVSPPADYSFPSGHTAACFAAAAALCIHDSRLTVPALLLSLLIAFSRLYLFVHYPSDILAGMLAGSLSALLAKGLINLASMIHLHRFF